jgi:hypothetical protein
MPAKFCARHLDCIRYVLLRIAVGRVNTSKTAENTGSHEPGPRARKNLSTGGALVENLMAQALKEESLIEKIRVAARANDKDEVFRLARRL